MGGKTGTTTQTVKIPPEVLARYNAVNKRAEEVAGRDFQKYSTDPSAFVAQINQQQQQGIGNINKYSNYAQPSVEYAQAGYRPENFGAGVQGYLNPYMEGAVGATAAQLQNINQQQQAQQRGSQIGKGAFGGDRAGVGMANLINQQNLATGQTLGQMRAQGYQDAARNYMAGLGQIGSLGLQGQDAFMRGAQAQVGAGTLQQQTEQAGKTALYNQFLQEQAYPFQVAQFLANIAMGTGALSGSTTTTTQPMPFFSDRRLKEDIKRIGESDEGLPIYKYKYKGDPEEQTHIGFMADEVEKKHPEAVGIAAGYKTVDYDKATSEGGAVHHGREGEGFAMGGMPYGAGLGYVPESSLPVGKLMTAGSAPSLPDSTMSQLANLAEKGIGIAKGGTEFYDWGKEHKFFASGGTANDDDPNITEKTKIDIPTDMNKPQLAVAGSPPSQGGSGMSDLANIAKFAMMIMGAKDGGRIGYAEGGGDSKYKIEPLDLERMPEHRQELIRGIYGPESGNRYNIMQGGQETFDTSGFHPSRIGRGGESTAAGAGQFIKSTWEDVTGGAPMTKPYQDAATWSLASRDYKARTGKDLDEDLQKEGFSPRIKEVLAPTWVALSNANKGIAAREPKAGIAAGKADMPDERAAIAGGSTPSGSEGGIGNFFAENQGWLAPLGAGLKAMASSKSPYLGAALLEGLGAGLGAYPEAQKTLQDIEYSKAAQAKVISEIPQNAIITDSSGRAIGVKVYVGNKLTTVPIAEYMRAQKTDRPYSVVPGPYSATSGQAPKQRTITTPEGDLTVSSQPSAAQGQTTLGTSELSPDLVEIARQNAEDVQVSGFKNLETSASANPFDDQEVVARASQADLQQRNTLTKALGSISRDQSLLASGKFSAAVSAPVVEYVNNLFSVLGRPDIQIARPEDLGNRETAEKISRMLAEKRTTQAGQRAYSALESILAAVPSSSNSPEGQANLLADLYYTQQRELDLDRFYKKMQRAGQEQTGITAAEARYMGRGLYDEFAKRNEQTLAKEKSVLKQMYMTPFAIKDPATGQTVQTYLLPYLAGKSGAVPENVKKAIQEKYKVGPEFFRYFSGQ